MDCGECKQNLTLAERARWGCGWLEPSHRTGTFAHRRVPIETDVCPGWLISLPQVLEAARAYGWRQQLDQFYEGQLPTAVLMDAIDVFSNEVEAVKAAVLSDAREGAKR